MNFYEMLSQHYDVIFPRGEKQSQFIDSFLVAESNLLDIGAGLGSYAAYFALKGHHVLAIDLDEDMVKGMQHKVQASPQNLDARQMDMLEIDKLGEAQYDGIYCIGNTLAHLPNFDLVNDFFEKAYGILNEGAWVIIQLVNYDRVLAEKVTELPVIVRDDHGLRFERTYDFISDKEVRFKGRLLIETEHTKDVFEADTELLALTHETLVDAARNVGFNDIELYGDYNKEPYSLKSPAIIMVARKTKS